MSDTVADPDNFLLWGEGIYVERESPKVYPSSAD